MQQKITHAAQALTSLNQALNAYFKGLTRKATHAKQRCVFAALIPLAALALYATPASGQTVVPYSADQNNLVTAPVVGLSQTLDDYFLTNPGSTRILDKNFNGNDQDVAGFSNPSTAKGAASFDNDYMLQLGTDNAIRKVNLTDGSNPNFSPELEAVIAGGNSFNIGYNPVTNEIAIGEILGSQLSFLKYNLNTESFSTPVSITLDSQYGTPMGLDFKDGRFLVGTKEGENQFEQTTNWILNYTIDGTLDRVTPIAGTLGHLTDVSYSNGKLALGFDDFGDGGRIQTGQYAIPEPKIYAMAAGAAALGFAGLSKMLGRREKKPSLSYNSKN